MAHVMESWWMGSVAVRVEPVMKLADEDRAEGCIMTPSGSD